MECRSPRVMSWRGLAVGRYTVQAEWRYFFSHRVVAVVAVDASENAWERSNLKVVIWGSMNPSVLFQFVATFRRNHGILMNSATCIQYDFLVPSQVTGVSSATDALKFVADCWVYFSWHKWNRDWLKRFLCLLKVFKRNYFQLAQQRQHIQHLPNFAFQ